ncbi:BLUF domain-containing protein [Roseovarius sp. SCSIO 43702]|uniref:BLUF domain-containing protein n=1 Tax=Roseovarius sp. SCSIO 43702 TaxID=2823043 RepID=UPI001C72DE6D|nr:BLUF domain-containing protein [Roseovarius sp. SCSIO 43702]QYX56173.1 BLUF domain-containing protein [Roseovarius sp. SCSIO 43702]
MTPTDRDLLRVMYYSHRADQPTADMSSWELDAILEASQRNNARVGVTGALIFNSGVFGQILEGPSGAVEETFERIQTDERHERITVLDIARIEERAFAHWSMGFVGTDALVAEMFGHLGSATGFDIAQLAAHEMFRTLHSLSLRKEIATRAA